MISKVLVANRGEIAIRAFRAAYEMGIATVAVYPYEDRNSLHRLKADESYEIGTKGHPVRAYLSVDEIIRVARHSGADAVYPGYGFLSENPELAAACEAAGITFVGPSPEVLELTGNKSRAIAAAKAAGLPVLTSSAPSSSVDELLAAAAGMEFPLFVKAVSGGGGRGMRRVSEAGALREAIEAASREAESAFGDPSVYLEQAVLNPRHIEVQILADTAGNVMHLFERDCSLQRRHQKVIEEAPSPAIDAAKRADIGGRAAAAARRLGYRSVGTMEFLYEDGQFYFIEMNTRLQVEHPVTEMICGLDLVREMMRVAAGAPLGFTQEEIRFVGHAIECRIAAENPETFLPCPGRVNEYHAPGGLGIRVDSALFSSYVVPPYYDSMIAKIIAHGPDRDICLRRLRRAIDECVVDGIQTTIPLHRRLLEAQPFIDGDYDIHWLERYVRGDD